MNIFTPTLCAKYFFVNISIFFFDISRGLYYTIYNIHIPCQEIFQVLLVAAIIFQLGFSILEAGELNTVTMGSLF